MLDYHYLVLFIVRCQGVVAGRRSAQERTPSCLVLLPCGLRRSRPPPIPSLLSLFSSHSFSPYLNRRGKLQLRGRFQILTLSLPPSVHHGPRRARDAISTGASPTSLSHLPSSTSSLPSARAQARAVVLPARRLGPATPLSPLHSPPFPGHSRSAANPRTETLLPHRSPRSPRSPTFDPRSVQRPHPLPNLLPRPPPLTPRHPLSSNHPTSPPRHPPPRRTPCRPPSHPEPARPNGD